MGNQLSLCTCTSKPRKKRRLPKKYNDANIGADQPYGYLQDHPGHVVLHEYAGSYRRGGVGISPPRDCNTDFNPEYMHREIAQSESLSGPSHPLPPSQPTSRRSSVKRQRSFNSNKRPPEAEPETSGTGSIKRQRSFNSSKHPPEMKSNGNNGHGSLKRQKSSGSTKRQSEPPRLVMWGLYEPKCPSKDWSLRVQQERVAAMEHGRAMWDGESSLPRYLRRYFRENLRHSEPSNAGSDLHREFRYLERPKSDFVQPSTSSGNENLSYVDHSVSESAVNTTNVKPFESSRLPPNPLLKIDPVHVNRFSESDSAFRSLSSFKSSDFRHVPYEDAFFRSRYTVPDPRCSSHKKIDLLSIYTSEKSTQYEEDSKKNSATPKVPDSTEARKTGSTDSYIALQESLDYLQSAVDELDSFAENFVKTSSAAPDLSNAEAPIEEKENFDTYQENPIFEPNTTSNSDISCQTENGTLTAKDVNSNVASIIAGVNHVSRKEALSFGSESELFPIMEVTEESTLPITTILKRALKISDSMETIERSEISLLNSEGLNSEGSSPAPSLLNERTQLRKSGSTYVKDGLVHYRIRVVASPMNVNLFRMSQFPKESLSKSLVEIAKESQCQLYLLPRKDYSAGVPKRTLLIRSLRRRNIKLCLQEISQHFPSLVRLR